MQRSGRLEVPQKEAYRPEIIRGSDEHQIPKAASKVPFILFPSSWMKISKASLHEQAKSGLKEEFSDSKDGWPLELLDG